MSRTCNIPRTKSHILIHFLRSYQRICPIPKLYKGFVTVSFLRWGVVNPSTNPQAGGPPLSAVYSTCSQLPSISGGRIPYPQPEDVQCRGNRDPHTQITTRNKSKNNRARWLHGNTRDSHSGGPGSNPGADQPDWGFFVIFLSHQGKCWVGFSLPRSIWPLFIKFIRHKN